MLFSTVVRHAGERKRVERCIDSKIAALEARRQQSSDTRQRQELTHLVNLLLDVRLDLLGVREPGTPSEI